eukprot:CAMPEP_0116866736 /NCGR_PEP_ID=MMETSP0418-20121206/26207_1 /TAXON_ID=1158023 /ORGANISM="Astrosyne radiata, Strain 13vi08-1A" /LENGTH=61 /DNA_ID=CAMNT_0004502429 /DNA_START=20 /DNA_END=202 /DNA_ORIENTATION=-
MVKSIHPISTNSYPLDETKRIHNTLSIKGHVLSLSEQHIHKRGATHKEKWVGEEVQGHIAE